MTHSAEERDDTVATLAPQNIRRVGLLLCMAASGFLVAHTINAFVADALYVIPERTIGSGSDPSGGGCLLSRHILRRRLWNTFAPAGSSFFLR